MKNGFSVIMPTYNQASFIRRAILSLQKQTFTIWELIIINDGCTDETEFFISDFLTDSRVKYIKNKKNQGLGYSINQGIDAAEYEYIAYLPSDDFYYENHLKSLMDIFEKYPETILTFSGVRTLAGDTMVNYLDKEFKGLKSGQTLQLVQVAHKKNKERWIERREWVSENLFDMYWKKLLANGCFAATQSVSCFWTDHPNQRHKIVGERFGGGLNPYRAFYKVTEPIKMKTSKYKQIDERELYKIFREKVEIKSNSLKILIVGELAYNSERIYALEQAGHQLYGLWIPKPNCTFYTVGHLPFGSIIDIPYDNWKEYINEIKPDVIYALLNYVAVDLAYDVLKANLNIPFVWHFKEGPSVCLSIGQWDKLIYLYTFSDGKIYLNETARDWYHQFIPQRGLNFIMDGDLPKKDYFTENFTEKLSARDNHIHTVIAGRIIGISPSEMEILAKNNIHVHLYSENYHDCREDFNNEMKRNAPNHFHIHPHCSAQDWTKEFSQYDAGWLHSLSSENNGELLLASWDDLNIPARTNTYASAGLPVIMKDNSQHTVAVQTKIKDLGYGIFFNDMEDLSEQLTDKSKMNILTKNAKKASNLFSFDYHVEDLISFFREVINYKKRIKMKERIIKISNILVMIDNQISNIGLTKGKMGIALFLYYSSKVTGYKFYQDLADSCIDKVLENIKSETNLSIANGMAGLAFTINHLIKDKFIDADPDDVLINVDKKIFLEYQKRSLNDFAEDFSLFTYGLYLLERTSYEKPESKMGVSVERATDLALNICEEVYNSNFSFNARTITYTDSVLYFLIKLNNSRQYSKRANSIIELIIAKIIIELNNNSKLWNYMDVIQNLGQLIHKGNLISQTFLSAMNHFPEEKKVVSDFDADKAWQGILFNKSYMYDLKLEMIDDLINDVDMYYGNQKQISDSCKSLIACGLSMLKRIDM